MLPSASNKSLISENLRLLQRPSVFGRDHFLLPSVALPLKRTKQAVSQHVSTNLATEQSPKIDNKDLAGTLCNHGEVLMRD